MSVTENVQNFPRPLALRQGRATHTRELLIIIRVVRGSRCWLRATGAWQVNERCIRGHLYIRENVQVQKRTDN